MPINECPADPRGRVLVLWLKQKRLEQGLSAAGLASRIGISRACITHLEAGRHRAILDTLLKISDGLGISPCDWFKQ